MSDSNKLIDSFFKKLAMPSSEDEDYSDIYEEDGIKHDEFVELVNQKRREYSELCMAAVTEHINNALEEWPQKVENDMNEISYSNFPCFNPIDENDISNIIDEYKGKFRDAVVDIKERLFKDSSENKDLF